MGAQTFYREAVAKTAEEAYQKAHEAALFEKGHREGYSGDLNSKLGFELVSPPKNVPLKDWLDALESHIPDETDMPDHLKPHSKAFERQFEIFEDKSAPALCFEAPITDPAAGYKRFLFVGYAAI